MHSCTLALFVGVAFTGGATLHAAEFKAAAGKCDVTPDGSVELWGYSDRSGPATDTLDPLYAKTVVLDDGSMRIAIVALDLGRTFGLDLMKTVRDRVKGSAGVHEVFFCASHTHSGPVIADNYEEGQIPKWEQAALDKIAATIEEAAGQLVPAKIGTGYGETYIGHNRRQMQPDGSIKMLWRNAAKVPTSPVDPRVGVIRIDSADGKTIAVLTNYSCHPVVLGPANLRYSADFPSAMSKVVEEKLDGAVSLYLQGGAGDINPYFDKMTLKEDGIKLMQETGQQLGDEVLRVAQDITPETPANPSVKYRLDMMHFTMRWDVEKVLPTIKARMQPSVYERYKSYLLAPLDCPVMTLLINDNIALAGMPGEPFVEFAVQWRDRTPVENAFFVGYANGYSGYFPTIRGAVEGGYGANSFVARAEVGAGEAMLNHSVVTLYELLGKLPRVPGS